MSWKSDANVFNKYVDEIKEYITLSNNNDEVEFTHPDGPERLRYLALILGSKENVDNYVRIFAARQISKSLEIRAYFTGFNLEELALLLQLIVDAFNPQTPVLDLEVKQTAILLFVSIVIKHGILDCHEVINHCMKDVVEQLISLSYVAKDNEVKKSIYKVFSTLLGSCTNSMLPHTYDVSLAVLEGYLSSDDDVAMEAIDFWYQFTKLNPQDRQSLVLFFPILLPKMLDRLVDKNEFKRHDVPDDSQSDDSYHSDEDLDDPSVLKDTAACFRGMVAAYGEEVISVMFPLLVDKVNTKDIKILESRIYALGVIAEGDVTHELSTHLPGIIDYLQNFMSNSHEYVRSTTCWTASCLLDVIILNSKDSPENREEYFKPVLDLILSGVQDGCQFVQKVACKALNILFEKVGNNYLASYFEDISRVLLKALEASDAKNRKSELFKAIRNFADHLEGFGDKSQHLSSLMVTLEKKWENTKVSDPSFSRLLNCLLTLLGSLAPSNTQFTEHVFKTGVALVENILSYRETNAIEPYGTDNNYFCKIFGLFYVMTKVSAEEVLNANFTRYNLQALFVRFFNYAHRKFEEVGFEKNMQSQLIEPNQLYQLSEASCLIGLVLKIEYKFFTRYFPNIMLKLLISIRVSNDLSENHIIRLVGEILSKWSDEDKSYTLFALDQLVPLISNVDYENARMDIVCTIGRIGICAPEILSLYLRPEFCCKWLFQTTYLPECDETNEALQGFCTTLLSGPDTLVGNPYIMNALFSCINRWKFVSSDLDEVFKEILKKCDELSPGAWASYSSGLPEKYPHV